MQNTSIPPNTGDNGRWLFETSAFVNTVNYEEKCLNWYIGEASSATLFSFYADLVTPQCPCDLFSVVLDRRFSYYSFTANGEVCFISRIPRFLSAKVR